MIEAIKMMFYLLVLVISLGCIISVIWVCWALVIGFYKAFVKKSNL